MKKKMPKRTIMLSIILIAILLFVYEAVNYKKDDLSNESIESVEYENEKSQENEFVENDEANEADETVNDNTDVTTTDTEFVVASEIDEGDDLEELEPASVSLSDVVWLDDINIHKDISATTMRGEQWSDCMGFGSSNINSDGQAALLVACDQKYSKFIAEIAPQEGFDKSEEVTLCIYGACDGEQLSKEEFPINFMTESFTIEIDISRAKELYIWKLGDYNPGRIAGQYINGNSGMGVLMHDATLYK